MDYLHIKGAREHNLKTVSYTHLDVYKRQGKCGLRLCAACVLCSIQEKSKSLCARRIQTTMCIRRIRFPHIPLRRRFIMLT